MGSFDLGSNLASSGGSGSSVGSGVWLPFSGLDFLSSLPLAGCPRLGFMSQNAALDSFGFSLRTLGGRLGREGSWDELEIAECPEVGA